MAWVPMRGRFSGKCTPKGCMTTPGGLAPEGGLDFLSNLVLGHVASTSVQRRCSRFSADDDTRLPPRRPAATLAVSVHGRRASVPGIVDG